MFDPNTLERKRITLDWDFSQFSELRNRLKFVISNCYTRSIKVWTSPLKGFHVEIWFYNKVNVALIRNYLKDDGNRLVMDILRVHDTHDVLWTYKNKGSIRSPDKKLVFHRVSNKTLISEIF